MKPQPELKPNEVIEVLPDGTVYYFDLNVCNEAADDALDALLDKEGVEPNFDFTASVYHLFGESIYILLNSGWTVENLLNEVIIQAGSDYVVQVDDDSDFDDDEDDD